MSKHTSGHTISEQERIKICQPYDCSTLNMNSVFTLVKVKEQGNTTQGLSAHRHPHIVSQ